MDPSKIPGSELVERYLQGRLTPAEEEAFEEAYLADPRLLEQVQLAERLREGLREHAAGEAEAEPRRGWLAVAAAPRYGIAASFVAAVALVAAGTLYVQNQALQGSGGFGAARHTRVLPLVSVRGDGDPNVMTAPAPDEWTVLLLDTGFADYDVFAAELRPEGSDARVRLDGMVATDGTVAFGMPGRVLSAGSYEVRLEGGRRDWPPGRALEELSRTRLTVTPAP